MKIRINIKSFLVSLCAFLISHAIYGQDTSKVLLPVPVFAKSDSILRISVIQSSVPHFELSATKMDELGAVDVGEALKIVPGIQLRDYGGIGGLKTVSFRSLGAGQTTLQVDGNQIPNVQSGVVNVSSFELFGLEKVSFTAGQVVNYNATASSYIQANTISLTSVLASKPNKMKLGVYGNVRSINAYETGVYFQHLIGKNFFAGVQVMSRFGNGQYKFIQPGLPSSEPILRQNTALFNARFRTVVGFDNKKHRVLLSVFHNNNTQELPGAAVLFNPSNDQQLWNKDWRINLNQRFKKGKWCFTNHANYQTNYTRYYDPFYANLQGFINAEFLQTRAEAGTMIARYFRFPNERVFFGTDFSYNTLNAESVSAVPQRYQYNTVLGGGTLFGKFKLDANLSSQLIFDEYVENKAIKNKTRFRISPFLAVAYMPFAKEKIRLRAFYKNTFRMPTFNDLYFNLIGNNLLEPEDANMINVGITYGKRIKRTTIEFTGDVYYNRVKNKIVAIPTKDLFNWSMQNIGDTEIKGVDLGLMWHLKLKNWQFTLAENASLNESYDITDPNSVTYKNQIPYTPYFTNTTSLILGWDGFKFSANVLYTGFRFSLNENIYANLLDSFTDVNLGVSKDLNWKGAKVLLDAKVMNLLNNNYQVIRSFPMPGRHLQIRIKYRLTR